MKNIEFEISLLRDYFNNIVQACENTDKDERQYIRSVAEIGYNMAKELLNRK